MTCQWCIHYRRRAGVSICFAPDKDGNVTPVRIKGPICERFSARRCCSTCEHRCSQEERDECLGSPNGCQKWELRKLSTWGGPRRNKKWPNIRYGNNKKEGGK